MVKLSNVGVTKLLELYHGPTLAFKDVAMQFIGNLYDYHLSKNDKKINIVVATSGAVSYTHLTLPTICSV